MEVLEGWLTQAVLEVDSEVEEMGEIDKSKAAGVEDIGTMGGTQSSAMEVDDEYVLLKRWWWYRCMLCYIYMESDPKPKESQHCH